MIRIYDCGFLGLDIKTMIHSNDDASAWYFSLLQTPNLHPSIRTIYTVTNVFDHCNTIEKYFNQVLTEQGITQDCTLSSTRVSPMSNSFTLVREWNMNDDLKADAILTFLFY